MGRPPFANDPTRMGMEHSHDRSEPFPKGHTISILHGIYSNRVRAPIEERIADVIRDAMSEGLTEAYSPSLDEHAIRRAARALCTIEMTEARIDQHGIDAISDKLFEHYKHAQRQATKWLTELGLTPKARAALGVDVAKTFDLISALNDRRQQRDATPTRVEQVCDECRENRPRYRHKPSGRLLCERCAPTPDPE